MPFLMPTLQLYPGLGLAEEYQKVIPQAEKKTNAELRESMGIEKISGVMRCSRLR